MARMADLVKGSTFFTHQNSKWLKFGTIIIVHDPNTFLAFFDFKDDRLGLGSVKFQNPNFYRTILVIE